jgi:cell shape-determining protein MreD
LPHASFWLAPLVSTLLWPWVFLLLDRYRSVARHRKAK